MRALSLIIAILISLAPLVAAQARYVVNGGTITSSVTLSAPTTIVEITGVTFSGALSFTIDISHMASSSRPVWVTLCNCVFQNAAALYFPADTSGVDTSKRPVYINIEGTQFIDGGLGFRGYFPLATRIVIAHVTVRINSRASLLPQWNPFNGGGDGRFAYWMALYNFYLQTQSSILFTGCDFGGSWASGTGKTAHASFPISLANSVNFIDRSSFWIRNTVTAKVFMIHSHGDVYATTLSSFVVENMTMVCDRFCLSFDAGNLQFSDRSVFVMADSSASVPLGQEGEDLFFTRSTTLFTTSSAFIIKNNVLSPYRYAFSVDPSVTFTVSTNSIATFYKNSVAGTPWRMTIATNNGGVALAQCNDLAGAPMRQIDQYQTAGLHGLTAASPCPRRTTDCQFSNSSCFMPGTVGMTATCECQCNSIGVGPSCLGSIRPLYVNQCLETASLLPTLTQRITLTERQSATRTVNAATVTHFKGTHSVSSSITEWRTTTKTKSPTITRDRKREASNTRRATPTHTFELTLTQWVTPSKTNPWVSTSSSVSHSRPRSETRSTSGEATATPTYRETRTHTLRLTRTALLTPTTTHSDEPSVTTSPTRTAVLSLSQALTPSHTRNTPSYTTQSATVTVTVNPPLTETVNLISLSWLATPTETHLLSPTDTLTPSPTGSETPSPSSTQNATVSETLTASVTVTSTLTASGSGSSSASETVTLTSTASLTNSSALTLSRTHSVTKSRSDCDWFVLGLEPIAPLALSSAGNNTMTIDYLTALEFGERFNLTGLGQWYVIATDYVGESSGVNETTSADLNVAAVVSGRIPTYYAPETERSITIGVTFRCAVVNHREIYTIVITPLPPVLSAAALETLLRLTSLASVLTVSPAAAAAAALSLIMQQIMLCRPLYENSAVSLAGLSIGDGDPMYLRGALVTNLLVVLCEAVLVSAFAAGIIVYSRSTMNAMRFWRVMEMLQWPNVMHISVSALLQLSTTAAVSLMSIADTVEDGGAAVLAFSCCFGYTVWITRQVYVMHKRTTGSARKWNMAEGLTTSGFVFGDYSKAWFVALETVVSFLVGLVAGIPPSLEVCLVQLFFIFFASLFVLAMLAWHRPYKTHIGLGFAIAVHAFIVMAAMSLIIGRFTRNPETPYSVAAFCLLFIPVAALLRGCWDMYSVGKNARGWWQRATSAECLQDMPWDNNDDEYMDGESSEDEELLNFGVAAPEKELSALLDSPLMMQDGPVGMLAATAVDIPPMKVAKGTKKGSSAKKSSAADVSSGQQQPQNLSSDRDINDFLSLDLDLDSLVATGGAAASSSTYVPPSLESIGVVNSSHHHVLDDLPELRSQQQQKRSVGREDAPAAGNIDDLIDGIVV